MGITFLRKTYMMTRHVVRRLALSVMLLISAATAHVSTQAADPIPLSIARQGYLFAGGVYTTINNRLMMSGHSYVEFQVPSRQTHTWPS
jgi:hypothetical protein